MRIIAPMMILIMMTSTLAGCTGGDPDGGGNDEIDMDILNQLIDDNLQDFINNTTITVVNHYHNNTTYVTNEYNNISNNEGDSVTENNFQTDYTNYSLGGIENASASNELLFVMHLELNTSDLAPELLPRNDIDPRLEYFSFTKNFTGYVWVDGDNSNSSNNSNGWYEQANIQITHNVPCSEFYIFESQFYAYDNNSNAIGYVNGDGTFWHYSNEGIYEDYWRSILGWNTSEDTSSMTVEDYLNAGYQSESVCNPEWFPFLAQSYVGNIGNITVPQGYMISGSVIEYNHIWDLNDSTESNETITIYDYSYPISNDNIGFLRDSGMSTTYSVGQYGGWEELTLQINLVPYRLFESSEFSLTILYTFTPVIPI